MSITPIGERVILQPIEKKDKTESGLYIPDEAKEEKKEGNIVAVGTAENGKKLPLQKGDHVLYGGYSADEVEIDGEDYIIVPFKDIIAKLD